AITAATSLNARIMGWENDVGSLEPGKFADVVAVPGNPLDDISSMERVFFVMQGGAVVRHDRER
ncbi:MAG: amidohydrolase family protein, partial [Longimicrobiales bacterium]